MQMLFRGQNILGYRHYGDDVVRKFVERAAINGIDVFRVFDAMNDPRNLETAIKAVKENQKHAQGTLSYTVSPVHTVDLFVEFAKQLEGMGADSVCIKDMAGLLTPYVAEELVTKLKSNLSIPVHMQSHATTGLSTATALKAIEAGIDNVDTAISSMSMTYGHSPTESVVAMLQGTERDTGLDINLLEEIAAYFREVRKKYAQFEGSLRGVDSRILVAQVPGGMLTNMENQLRDQGAADKIDDVLAEIPKVREDLGFIPLVTPTSQIVGTQAVMNVMFGERYKSISKETQGVLKGEYGATPAPVNAELQARVLEGAEPITCRPADLISDELANLTAELSSKATAQGITLTDGDSQIDDVLTYALFPEIGLKFLKNRGDASAFEPAPTLDDVNVKTVAKASTPTDAQVYTVSVQGQSYVVQVNEGGDVANISPSAPAVNTVAPASPSSGEPVTAPLAGNIFKVPVSEGEHITQGDIIVVLEAMKMETEVRAQKTGTVTSVSVKEGDTVSVGDELISIA
jgi:oxaloacetate decarboxylase alpha subunit